MPYGLVRYGVAPDHQGTKAVIRQFERLFERQGVDFFGNVDIGRDITLDDLRGLYDAVVLATGLGADRKLGIPGEDLPGVMAAGDLTRGWNDHPDAPGTPARLGKRVIVMGNGNVAIDLVRILAKTDAEFDGSDFGAAHTDALRESDVTLIEVIGRGPAHGAKFDPVMLRELGKLSDAAIEVIGADAEGKLAEALAAIHGHAPQGARRMIRFRFGWTPVELQGTDRLRAARFAASDGSGAELHLDCDSFLTAIGFEARPAQDRDRLLADATEDGKLADGLYAAGWFKRGPQGTIPENRADAQSVAARIAADLAGVASQKPGRAGLRARLPDATDHAGWQRIDAAERADPPQGRCRQKIRTIGHMLDIARPTISQKREI